jgi:uncharacterized protein YndB with AHSA1/START domain
MTSSTDHIERDILLKAPRSRVWAALADAEAFGTWFGVALKGQRFEPGARAHGHITHPGYEHVIWDVQVERIEPQQLFSFRWHPYAVDPAFDYSSEPTTLVEFELQDSDEGCRLRLLESGFDNIPQARRREAFRMHGSGWSQQMSNIEKYLGTL